MTDFPDLKMKAVVQFPARVDGGTGIDVTKSNGSYRFDLDFGDFAPPVAGVSDPTHQNALLWNSLTGVYTLTPFSLFSGFGANGSITTTDTGYFYAPNARIHRLADRVFIGDATDNTGQNVVSQPDWLTQFQISTGRVAGWIHRSQSAMLTSMSPEVSNAVVMGAQSAPITLTGLNSIATTMVAVNNNSAVANVSAYAGYNEAFRMSGALGGAYGYEIDTINYATNVIIDPFQQTVTQTIGLQLASGAELSAVGQFPSTAAINIRNNNSAFNAGIIFGNTAITGTNGNDSGLAAAIKMATGHGIQYFYAAGNVSWTLNAAAVGINGDYNFTTAGTGSVSVPALKETLGNAWTAYTPTITANAGTFTTVAATGRYRQLGKTIFFSVAITITTNGTASGNVIATLPFTSGAGVCVVNGRESAVAGKMLCGFINPAATTVVIANYDNTYPGSNGAQLIVSGMYERN